MAGVQANMPMPARAMPRTDRKILAVMNDLFFQVKIMETAKRLGLTVEFLKDRETALEKVKAQPAAVIFDLNYAAADPLDLIRRMKADPETGMVTAIGFVSHVQTELRLKAQESGCDLVVARSAFAQNLPAILQKYSDTSPTTI
jgi:CheY-like chemotaxis protein